jgi:hypothetical protein
MRKVFFVLVCTLIPAGLFAEAELLDQVERNTTEGQYFVSLYRVGKNLFPAVSPQPLPRCR